MKQEEKQLLSQDLCARLPWGVILQVSIYGERVANGRLTGIDEDGNLTVDFPADCAFDIGEVKPYLRPMSSMTKEERSYYEDRWFEGYHTKYGDDMVSEPEIPSYIDWLNANYFDYRGLIPKGLALEASKDMYEL